MFKMLVKVLNEQAEESKNVRKPGRR
jgi:hypothetical protein